MAKRINEFPQVVFVTVTGDNDGDFLLAHSRRSEALGEDEQKRVGMYKFVEVHDVQKALPHWKKARSRKTR